MNGAKPPLIVFAYAFAHRKTQDFLLELVSAGYDEISVVAAPWLPLGHRDDRNYYPATLRYAPPRSTQELCHALGLRYLAARHDDINSIEGILKQSNAEVGIIAGARVLRRDVIELFERGVVNFHPGKLPETAGLDAFFYSLQKDIPLGVTAHFIDSRIDAGMQLFFEETPIGPFDNPEVVAHNNYQSQITALRRFLDLLERGALNPCRIERPYRNLPMEPDQKQSNLERFVTWREARLADQSAKKLVCACETGDLAVATAILDERPELVEHRTPEGWTPLIVAAFNQHPHLIAHLVELGANPNVAGRNGTTPLMYAKTALLHDETADYKSLEILLESGGDPRLRDSYGHDIFHYVNVAGDVRMLEWLKKRTGVR